MRQFKKRSSVEAEIPVLIFQEVDKVVAYSPALDLCTYGSSEEHAKKRFAEAVDIFIKECVKMGTLHEVLEECGWRKAPDKQYWTPPIVKSFKQEIFEIPV